MKQFVLLLGTIRVRTLLMILLSAYFIWFLFGFELAIFMFILLTFITHKWDSRILAVLAILLLLICSVIIIDNEDFIYGSLEKQNIEKTYLIDRIAIYAFFLLIINIVIQALEYLRSADFSAKSVALTKKPKLHKKSK